MKKMTPVIEVYKNGNPMGDALFLYNTNNPDHELAAITLLVYQTITDPSQFEKNIITINKLDYCVYDIEEQLIFLEFLFWLYSSVVGRQNNARSIISVMKSLMSNDLAIEFQIIPSNMEAILKANEGQQSALTNAYEISLDILKGKSNRYKKILWDYLIHLCNTNEYEKIEINLAALQNEYGPTQAKRRYDYILLLLDISKAKWQNIASHIQNINEDLIFSNFYRSALDLKLKLSNLFVKFDEKTLDVKNADDCALLSYLYLIRKNNSEALQYARMYGEAKINYKNFSSFDSYCLLRSDLAIGNAKAAEFFLENKNNIGNHSIYDDFFWFRVHLLKGNIDLAQKYFNSFNHTVEKFDLFDRYDTELMLSPEITIKDLRYFINHYHQNKSQIPIQELNRKYTSLIDYQEKKDEQEIISVMVGQHPSILEVKSLIKKMAQIDTPILINGETGTGKDLVAKALWKSSPLKNKKFIAINCGAISDHLLQSELFGHKKGAFTGAVQDHKGYFEEAQGGIVFLDEIGEISPKMQVSLLRILESGEYRAIGGTETKNLNCKIIFATNRQLSDLVKKGLFRQDLQFRLERLIIALPPLRERASDIPLLIDYFLNKQHSHLLPIAFDEKTLEYLRTIEWEGNIRELRNEMERIRLFHSDKKTVGVADLSEKYRPQPNQILKKQSENKSKPIMIDDQHLNFKSKFRKLDELKNLFQNYRKLSRSETARLLKVSLNTAANYLLTLEKEAFAKKITPSNAVKTHYYEINDEKIFIEKNKHL